MTTTVEELIAYLQTLPPKTEVSCAVHVDGYDGGYTAEEDLELPARREDGSFEQCSDNIDFTSLVGNQFVKETDPRFGKSYLFIGRR